MSTDPTMAENRKLDMSLDDIIRLDGIKGPRRGGGRSGPPGGGGGRRDNFSRGSGGSNGRYQPKRLNTGGGFRANSYNGDRSYQQNRSGYSNGGGYRGRSSANGFEGGRGLGGGGGGRRQCTLHVSNLASTVNAEDVEELFSTFGDLVRSTVHYDQHGSSLGTADVVFEQRENATEARHKLNNVPLDGKPLRITMLNETDDDPFQSFLRMGNSNNRRNGGGGDHYHQQNRSNHYQNNNRSSNRMSGGGGGGGNRGPRRDNNGRNGGGGGGGPAPSAEDLDKEMDDWRMQVDADKN
ncbi:hypothetical protein TYRP_009583 [Tyrophagus putrescentiae]|nr:hypothetical protein TYRP_009583 [Tyrophagus putrescentiae]